MYKGQKVAFLFFPPTMRLKHSKNLPEIPTDLVDEVILCDDFSTDETSEEARRLGIDHVIRHEQNKGYGGKPGKTLYNAALEAWRGYRDHVSPGLQYTRSSSRPW